MGLPDASVKEARDRVVAAVRNSGFDFPVKKITVNLAPAGVKKEGAAFDLPIAIGILSASEVVNERHLSEWCMVGELALDGSLRPVKGVLPIAIEIRAKKLKGLILPAANMAEAMVVKGIQVFAAKSLADVVEFLGGDAANGTVAGGNGHASHAGKRADFPSEGAGFAKRALRLHQRARTTF